MLYFKMLLIIIFGKSNGWCGYRETKVSLGKRCTRSRLYKYKGVWYDIEFTEVKEIDGSYNE